MKRILLTVLILVPTAALGFSKGEEGAWENLKQLRPGQKIEVVEMSLKAAKGTLVNVSDEALVLKVKGANVTIERANAMRVTVRDTSKRTRNMLIGAAAGVGAGLAIGLPVNAIASNEGTGNAAGVAALAAMFGGAGAGLGAIPGNRTVYRAENVKAGMTSRAGAGGDLRNINPPGSSASMALGVSPQNVVVGCTPIAAESRLRLGARQMKERAAVE